ncbi:MAG: acetate kinase [Candidatus Pacearchaeota archaeon]|nr:MAG: acetate kinase [Candidatus Pacearchaeota archaeon]
MKRKILIFNIGSKTIKYAFYENNKVREKKIIYTRVNRKIIEKIVGKFNPDIIVHRIVHGGPISKPCFITPSILKKIKKYSRFAPLHNPHEIRTIEICRKFGIKQIGVFDTAFFSELPEKTKTYALPSKILKKYKIRRYGFHGINHQYVSEQILKQMRKKNLRIVTCHLGAGCSISAVLNGKAVDTSMGLTPLEGPCMVTRSGSIDPGIILFLIEKFSFRNVEKMLNKKSGLFALSGITDVEKIVARRRSKKYKLAFEFFCYNIAKYIASYTAALNGIDVLAFSGGIGEASKPVRQKVLSYLKFLPKFKVFVIKANEEEAIFKEALKLLKLR